ncbi:transposable element Tcb1 transposase [Caerostris darwini]|uniref:Transposable element Tcb1 transposase n=1 Tax=Caerostris darwini TaxID=1538125 RepID=A0AAV4QZY2_9ARAC|nr:transposable element Tcb1 transposase [Caerostris darwini]
MDNIANEFRQATGVAVSTKTLRIEAHKLGYTERSAAHRPLITKTSKKACLRWAKDHRTWTLDDWKRILWSDESRFTLFRSDGRVWVWRLPGERLLPECVVPTVKFSGGGLMVWACFSWYGAGPLVKVDGAMNADILDNHVLPTLWATYGMDGCWYQDNNATCHVARRTLDWYVNNSVKRMEWPAQSPDLNPIEHLWDELDRRLRACTPLSKSKPELWNFLLNIWKEIPLATMTNLVESMPRRVAAVIAAKGGPTSY